MVSPMQCTVHPTKASSRFIRQCMLPNGAQYRTKPEIVLWNFFFFKIYDTHDPEYVLNFEKKKISVVGYMCSTTIQYRILLFQNQGITRAVVVFFSFCFLPCSLHDTCAPSTIFLMVLLVEAPRLRLCSLYIVSSTHPPTSHLLPSQRTHVRHEAREGKDY